MKKVSITCDCCLNDLHTEGPYPGFRLCLSNEPLPTGSFVYSMNLGPHFDTNMYFCNAKCLKSWVENGFKDAGLT